ncbi:integrase core domain-containing protein [Galbitalea sp. SE-J8]|uniref:integrase core domain-containing protein n=1 Tax=Galbitalea sp. SE-J8 TaxID=3054952 RepID=UPI00259CA5CA|nr:integrase core domain-containing protein [Galbitalea sp. SE-J8]MDM4764435.1 integrase core domain-containing protein [Galbitalea sp. SE-J8]
MNDQGLPSITRHPILQVKGRPAFPDQATAYRAVFRWANRYNTRRRHSAIGNIAPNAYEAAASAILAEAA